MKKVAFVLCMSILATGLQAQDTLSYSLYFEFNSKELTANSTFLLDSLVKRSISSNLMKVSIIGNTDNAGSQAYNIRLSKDRARVVYDYLMNKGFDGTRIEILAQGESLPLAGNEDDLSRRQNRRVDLEAVFSATAHPTLLVSEPTRIGQEMAIETMGGLELIMPESAFSVYQNRDLMLKASLVTNTTDFIKQGISTMSTDGDVLSSLGMICFEAGLKHYSQIDSGFRLIKPMKVMVPVKKSRLAGQRVFLWEMAGDSNGWARWQKSEEAVEVENIKGKDYYVFQTTSLNCVNLDCYLKSKLSRIRIPLLDSASLYLVYPNTKAVVVGRQIAPGVFEVSLAQVKEYPRVYVEGRDSKGNLLKIQGKSLRNFKYRYLRQAYVINSRDFKKSTLSSIRRTDRHRLLGRN